MTKRLPSQVLIGAALLALSALLYLLHFSFFHDAPHILDWVLAETAFIPIQVLVVTLILDRMLAVREQRLMLNKLNMVIGVFFSEIGTTLLAEISRFNPQLESARGQLKISGTWSDKQFIALAQKLKGHVFALDAARGDLKNLRALFIDKRNFLLTLLENPNLLEHETFTELLWAVFHLAEELEFRADVTALPPSDLKHIANDMQRAYSLLIYEWLMYLKHLKNSYPYLFSLALRLNPFDPSASAIILS
ncbi:MAG: hypothetical protein PHC61_02005 [Chitinivibrionales bacterium]|nr:hypothetical protein [Chitinivibrionales bacterium]